MPSEAMLVFDTLVAFLALFYLYIFSMGVRKAWPNLSLWAKVLVGPVVLLALVWDWAVNMTFACLVFADLPRSWKELVTGRLQRYRGNHLEKLWRRVLADYICEALNQFDPSGRHC